MVSERLDVYFLHISMPWVFLGFLKYSPVGTALPHLDPASAVFTQGTSRTSTPNLKIAGHGLVSQWTLLIQILYSSWPLEISPYSHAFIWRIYLWRMHGVPKDFLHPWYKTQQTSVGILKGAGRSSVSVFSCFPPWLKLVLIFSV